MYIASAFAAGLTFLGICLVVCMILAFALPVLMPSAADVSSMAPHSPSTTPFSWLWQPSQGAFGILPMLMGSLMLGLLSLLLGWPLALALCFWLLSAPSCLFTTLLRPPLRATIRFMTAIPTVVYGFAAVFLLTPLIRTGLGGSGMGWISAVCMLTLLILPTMVLVLEAGLKSRLEKLCPHGLALGLNRRDLLWFFVVPQARTTLISAAILGFGRAVGDTLLPLMLTGNAPHIPEQITDSVRTLTAHMALVSANEVGGNAYNSLFVAGMLLLLINAVVSLALRRLASPEIISEKNGKNATVAGASA